MPHLHDREERRELKSVCMQLQVFDVYFLDNFSYSSQGELTALWHTDGEEHSIPSYTRYIGALHQQNASHQCTESGKKGQKEGAEGRGRRKGQKEGAET